MGYRVDLEVEGRVEHMYSDFQIVGFVVLVNRCGLVSEGGDCRDDSKGDSRVASKECSRGEFNGEDFRGASKECSGGRLSGK